jgi:hypothetical protein
MGFNKANRDTTTWHNEGHQLMDWAKSDYDLTIAHNNYIITDNGHELPDYMEEEFNRVGWQSCTECFSNPSEPFIQWRLVSDDYDNDEPDDSEWNLDTVGHIGIIYPMQRTFPIEEFSCLSGGGKVCGLCLDTITYKWAVDEGCPHIQIKENGKWVTQHDSSFYG